MASVKDRPAKPLSSRGSEDGESQYYSRAVAKALEILEVLGAAGEPLSLNQLTPAIKLTKPSLFRLLFTLEETGYVEKDSEGRYVLRHDIRRNVREKRHAALLQAATPVLRDLTREFRETTGLAVLFDNHIEVIAVVESPQTVRMGNTVGRILQPHASSLGKCITAFQPEHRRDHLVRSYGISVITPKTIVDENALAEEFAHIRKDGYASDRGETCLEGQCFGAPIFGSGGDVFAAVSISLPVTRLGGADYQQKIVERIRLAAEEIGRAINL